MPTVPRHAGWMRGPLPSREARFGFPHGCSRWRVATALVILLLACAGCRDRVPIHERVPEFSGTTMGTVYKAKVMLPDPAGTDLTALQHLIEAELEGVNAAMSTYLPDSELSRFNTHASTTPFPVSAATLDVFRLALEISERTNGAFDITVGPLVNAWGFGPGDVPENPLSDNEIQALKEHVGYQKVTIDPVASTVRKDDPALYCDLSAIAKGYGVDRVCAALENAGFHDYMVEVGGEVRTGGLNGEGAPWRIGVVRPDALLGDVETVVPMSGWSMATSGDYRNFYERNGVRYSHEIDPHTGRPISHNLASASVIHKECAVADGYATALMVMGPEEALHWANENDMAAFFIVRTADGHFRDIATKAFEQFMAQAGESRSSSGQPSPERRE
ncbi:MAG TPA: FAD:protein FMN transferase [Candidatus Hydrogenedentes bacterium]|nr:FAD:protein FMN transferase [Candidatus Hydrogenedentota bacterium]HQM47536.1 FAD:protein FMN transferase [Candidatus Hydrogenedentota bacterium]